MDVSADIEMRRLSREAQEFFEKILFDEAPLFVYRRRRGRKSTRGVLMDKEGNPYGTTEEGGDLSITSFTGMVVSLTGGLGQASLSQRRL